MVSRSDKEKPKPLEKLTVAQRCKPMRVAKAPRKPRTHKVKQGAPPKLSASQKRKLVRLYLFTNLSWKSMSDLVLHFGSKNVEKRALQYVLQGLLGSQYNQMRPREVDSRRKRRSQIQKLKGMKPIQGAQHTAVEMQNQPTRLNEHRATNDHLDHIGYPNQFDFLIRDVDHDYQNANLLNQGLEVLTSSVLTSDPTCSPLGPPLKALSAPGLLHDTNTCTGEFSSATHTESIDPAIPNPDPSFGTYFEEHLVEHDLFEFIDQSNVSPIPGSVAPAPESSFNTRTSIASSAEKVRGSSRPRKLHQQDTDSVIDGLNLRGSNLSDLISRLSKCSEDEKRFVNDLLKHYSVSTLSSITNSIHSNPSLSVRQEAECSYTPPSVLVVQPQRRQRHPMPVEILDLPGDFITSKINTFSHHVACKKSYDTYFPASTHSQSNHYCESCCTGMLSTDDIVRLCIPLAVIDFKRGLPAQQIWSEGGELWVDRFGNTALHIAAALGAKYDQLRGIMSAGVSVHEVNSAGQTFMHVLRPRHMCRQAMFSLSHLLEKEGFDFRQLDVLGQTFLDHFASCGIDPLDFALCWIEPCLKFNEHKDQVIGNSFASELFITSGGSREQWEALGWCASWTADNRPACGHHPHLDELGHELYVFKCLVASALDPLRSYKNYRDRLGRSCLHIATSQECACSDSVQLNEHLKLVQDLLSAGHNPDVRDVFGETTLMRAIVSSDCETLYHEELFSKKKCYNQIIEELLNYGANINARNPEGETALHVSVELGRISATQILLRRGANIHARDSKGRGVLAVGIPAWGRAMRNDGRHAKISACMALAVDAGAVASPTLFQEWDMWKVKSPYQVSQERSVRPSFCT
ncbi:MAG: hypothetical protein Q9182_002468 [Xanthomendoza sp. 2 TL-2023]